MNNLPLVSVIIATYNMGHFLGQAVQSVLSQDYNPIEVLIVDDGSTDQTKEVVKSFLNDQRVRYYYQDNSGQAVAKNKGISESNGDMIAFLDADDFWESDKLETQIAFMLSQNSDVGVVYTNFSYVNENGSFLSTPQRTYYSGFITGQLLIENFVTGMTAIVRRNCFEELGLFDESIPMGIDYDLWLRISTKYKFLFMNEITYYYRIWPGQMSRKAKLRMEYAIQIMNRFLEKYPNIVSKKVQNEAWAHTYVTLGRVVANTDRKFFKAFDIFVKALRFKFFYWLAWKEIIKLMIGRN